MNARVTIAATRRDRNRWSRIRLVLATSLIAGVVAACSGGGGDGAKSAAVKPARQQGAAKVKPPKPVGEALPDEVDMANAVVTSKSDVPIDLRYDLASRPLAGQPFELQLSFAPRQAVDALEVEIAGIEGLTVVNAGQASFRPVQSGERYKSTLLLSASTGGMYYVNVSAQMVSKVQTDERTFSVPIVIGAASAVEPLAAAAPQPAKGRMQ